ncbi:MAG: magnesium/cobalt transporter CorA [Anaerolineaceae bacterium]|nr:magnesium/cobalt transporter CorA [Anaerolineaceae bacterium]
MIRAVHILPNEKPLEIHGSEEIRKALNSSHGFIWVSLETVTEEEVQEILNRVFKFHHLAIEDCLSSGYQVSKIDDFKKYIFLITHALAHNNGFEDLHSLELNLFLGANYLVTCYTDPSMPSIKNTWNLIWSDERFSQNGPDFLCHRILDTIVDDYMPLIDTMETEVEWLEDSAMEKPTPETLQRLLAIKHSILSLRRIITPQREVMNRLSRDSFSQIKTPTLIYFRDIYDHLVRIQDLADTIRDIVSGTLDIYLNSTNLRLNEIMKALTIVSTVFLPLSFITGAFGMNFIHIPGAKNTAGFYIICLLMLMLALVMLIVFKRRRWF